MRAYLAAPLERSDLEFIFEGQWQTQKDVHWNAPTSSVSARTIRCVGSLVIDEKPMEWRDERVVNAMVEGITTLGLACLPWDQASRSILDRSEWLRAGGHAPQDWPDFSDAWLTKHLGEWLGPYLEGIWRREQLTRLDLVLIVSGLYSHPQRSNLDRLAPMHLQVPSGSKIVVEYRKGEVPVLAVKLQEMFGATKTPTVAGGRVNVVLHLLSPARRPLAVTQDLPSFWKNTYPKLRTQMRADYPRHPWPEDPMTAVPTKKTVRKRK